MNFVRTLAVVMMIVCGAALATAKDKAPASKPASKPASDSAVKVPKGYFSMMAAELKMDDAQRAKLKEKVDAENAALEPLKLKLDADEKAIAAAKESKNKEAMKAAMDERDKHQAEMDKIRAGTMDEVMALLTPEQKEHWKGFDLYRTTKQRVGKLDLSAEQDAKIRQMAMEQGKKIVDLKDDQKAINDLEASFMKAVKEQVLNDSQRAALDAQASQPKSKPAGEPKKK